MITYFRQGGQVGIYDATNATDKARRHLLDAINGANLGIQTIFLECLCDDQSVIAAAVEEEMHTSPDYEGSSPMEATADFELRIEKYRKAYETIDDPELSFVKLINVGKSLQVNRVKGHLPTRIVYFLMNTHIVRRNIFLCRVQSFFLKNFVLLKIIIKKDGQSTDDTTYKVGATAELSASGRKLSHKLKEFMDSNHSRLSPYPIQRPDEKRPLLVWTSTSERSKQTAADFPDMVEWKALVDLNPGVCDGLSEEQIKAKYPEEYERHRKDPFSHRYPRAESYRDLALRLEPVILELERHSKDVMIVAHETVLRCLLAYFGDIPVQSIPGIEIKENTLIRLVPHAYQCDTEEISLK